MGHRSPDVPDSIPERLGPFRIERKLGTGSMGTVFLAVQEKPMVRRVALKLVRPDCVSSEVLERFAIERRALAALAHPGIAALYEAGKTEDGVPYFAMEFVPGVPITRYCDDRRLDITARLRLFMQVCDAVQHAHLHGVIHRDLKPANILVMDRGGEAAPKVIDFGIAKRTGTAGGGFQTLPGLIVGTPDYMSPEQAAEKQIGLDVRVDIYALGVLLAELLAGRPPLFDRGEIESMGIEAFLLRLRNVDPPRPSARILDWKNHDAHAATEAAAMRRTSVKKLAGKLAGDLDWICLKALSKDREQRYPTPAALAADIDRHLNLIPVVARPPGRGYRWGKFVRRHRAAVVVGTTVILALVIGLAVSVKLYLTAEASRRDFIGMGDIEVARKLESAEKSLWPARPEQVQKLENWLAAGERLVKRLPELQAALTRLPQVDSGADLLTLFKTREVHWKAAVMHELVSKIQNLARPGHGALDRVKKRLAWAKTVHQRTLIEPAETWRQAIASIGDAGQCPAYNGLCIAPQLGLIPIGRDPDSGLWEFGHPGTGEVPERDSGGRLILNAGTGLVFVLLPGGKFLMGARKPKTGTPDFSRQEDKDSFRDERPVSEVTLAPFFLSKYEMTQAQWKRFTGVNPSTYSAYKQYPGKLTPMNPVESVSHERCEIILGRLDLVLPTEAQWEYACRAGTTGIYSFGSSTEVMARYANIYDRTAHDAGFRAKSRPTLAVVDGFVMHAPVGRFGANPFGLHDMHGNVMEWCSDGYGDYARTRPRPGDGLRMPRDRIGFTARGGSWMMPARDVRSARRTWLKEDYRGGGTGVRPALVLRCGPPPPGMKGGN